MRLELGDIATFTVSAVPGELTGTLVSFDASDDKQPYEFETDTGYRYWPYQQNINLVPLPELVRIEAKLDAIISHLGIPYYG